MQKHHRGTQRECQSNPTEYSANCLLFILVCQMKIWLMIVTTGILLRNCQMLPNRVLIDLSKVTKG